MTVVVDTNVLLAALVTNGLCHELVHRLIRLRLLATSPPLIAELETTLRKKFTVTVTVETFLKVFRESVRTVQPAPLPGPICRDKTDDVVLATAEAAGAAMIVTGDQDLLVLKSHNGIRIVTPRAMLEWLDRR